MPTSYANGLDIYYEERGRGRPLILIHGGTLTGQSWEPYLPSFAAHFRVIMPDTRGHGRTANPGGQMSFRLIADDVASLAQALGLEKPLIFGYSDGGQAALELGMRYPDLARALVIGGAYPELPDASRVFLRSLVGPADSPNVDLDQFERNDPGYAAMLRQLHGDAWGKLLRDIKPMWYATLNYTDADFAKITAPALVVTGDRDELTDLRESVGLYRQLPNAEFAVVPGSDHGQLLFSPEKIALAQPLILNFLLRQG
jgi:pimeloyl-ACP methyl ester carboxylesterase